MPSEEPGKGLTGTPDSQLVAGTILEDGDGNPQLEVLNTVTFEKFTMERRNKRCARASLNGCRLETKPGTLGGACGEGPAAELIKKKAKSFRPSAVARRPEIAPCPSGFDG